MLFAVLAVFTAAAAASRDVEKCNMAVCPTGFTCRASDKLCVGIGGKELEIVGECVNMLCPESYACVENVCIRAPPRRLAGSAAIGPCVNTKCPADYICEMEENKCYPTDKSVSILSP